MFDFAEVVERGHFVGFFVITNGNNNHRDKEFYSRVVELLFELRETF